MLDQIGQEWLPGGDYSVVLYSSHMAKTLPPVEQALRDALTAIIF
ncbi:MAG: hypothetical protein AAF639_28950 [Chloroflexota bacterium]